MKRYLSFSASSFLILIYVSFTFLSLRNFPTPFSPLSNWLSDLGSYELNPQGAIYYNIGIVGSGLILLLFFLGLTSWRIAGHRKQNAMLFLTQLFGCLGALAMVLSAVYPIDTQGIHGFWSAGLYILLGTSFAFSAAALRYHIRRPMWLLILGILVAIEDMVWSLVLNTFIFEWITVGLFLLYVFLLGKETYQHVASGES